MGNLVRTVRVPKDPPALNDAPPFRRTVRIRGTIATTATLTFTIASFRNEDNVNYGVSTGSRWQGGQVNSGRVYLFSTTSSPPSLQVAVHNPIAPIGTSQSIVLFEDMGSVSAPCSLGWQWPVSVRQVNVSAGNTDTLFTITNASLVDCRYITDLDVTWTG